MVNLIEKLKDDFPGLFDRIKDKKIEFRILDLKEEQKQIEYRIKILEDVQNGKWKTFIEYLDHIKFPGCRCDTDGRRDDDGLYFNPETNVLHICIDFDNIVPDVIDVAKKFGIECRYYWME